MKKLVSIIFVGIILFSLCSCSFEYDYSKGKTVDGVYYVFSNARKVCFAERYAWNEGDKSITINIPDEIDGYKVVALGGYTGRGVPTCFGITTPNDKSCGSIESIEEDTIVEEIPVTIHLGKNVKQIDCSNLGDFLQTEESTYIFLAKFEIDEENIYFKADESGKLTYSKYSENYIDRFNYKTNE